MSEQHMRQRVISALKLLDAQSVENRVRAGMPDVNYIEGWIECKQLDRWPRNCDTMPVLIEHFTQQQRIWLDRRRRFGGRAFLLLQVGCEWLLFDAATAVTYVGKATRPVLLSHALRYWPTSLDEMGLLQCVSA